MTTQSEQTLEDNLIARLQEMKYERVTIADEKDLLANLKTKLEQAKLFKKSLLQRMFA